MSRGIKNKDKLDNSDLDFCAGVELEDFDESVETFATTMLFFFFRCLFTLYFQSVVQ